MFYLLAALFLSAPLYVVRFNVGLPVNLLEILSLAFLLVFAFWLKKEDLIEDFKEYVSGQPRLMLVFAGLLLLAGFISAIIAPSKSRGAGLFAVWFFIPIAVYLPASYILAHPGNKIRFIKLLFILVGALSVYGIFQYFTSIGLPLAWQGNPEEPRRALSVFDHPNGFALFLTPILALLIPFVFDRQIAVWYKLAYVAGLAGLLFSLSRGGWLGFIAAAFVYVLFFAKQKIAYGAITGLVCLLLIISFTPSLHSRISSAWAGDRSTESRYSLWQTAVKMIKDSPILGQGLYGYKLNYDKFSVDKTLPSINLGHNIFLNFWVETGLLGLLAFISIVLFALYRSLQLGGPLGIGIILFLVAIIAHGFVDNPYMKNDLALAFWIILALQS